MNFAKAQSNIDSIKQKDQKSGGPKLPTSLIEDILHPNSIAIVGATQARGWGGGGFVESLIAMGYKGKIYPVNPKYPEIMGLKAYPSLRDVPGRVDYVISSVPAPAVPGLLNDAGDKGVKTVHLFTARFSETGRPEGIELEQRVLKLAREYGLRLIGPNCMGIYYPAGGLAYHADFPKEPGAAGLVSQSGMLSREIIQIASQRGVFFSKVFSYGNALDLNECDFLEYLAQDPETRLIMFYVEGVKNGRRFFDTLKQAVAVKPVILLKGGAAQAGARATASHTASLAGSYRVWQAAAAQTGAVWAGSFEELIDLAASFYFLPPAAGRRAGVIGGTGGTSVLAADRCEQAGLEVIPLPDEFREELKKRGVSVWDWLSNPIDLSIREDESLSVGLILEMMAQDPNFDLLISLTGVAMGRAPTGPGVSIGETVKQQYRLDACRNKPLFIVVPENGAG
ncbi:MAG TPA: CoA-binding protein, partial [Dehalococcoidales bacterium]|nr:CoA-binding protein [Dehalococcoidales bacterium]